MKNVAFKFENYRFVKANLDLTALDDKHEMPLDVTFNPQGEFIQEEALYKLHLSTQIKVRREDKEIEMASVECVAEFRFADKVTLEQIPEFFYPNSIAILFPYIRAFVSTLTLQANIMPIVLPTMNLTSLQEELKNNTTVI